MDIVIHPTRLNGTISAIPSKSQAHRMLICAAFSQSLTTLRCKDTNQDIEATVDCLNALGANILRTKDGYTVTPITELPKEAILNCRESGSTLRFLLPIVGALGVDCTFQMSGRLPSRPLSPLWEVMERMGCVLSRPTHNTVRCTGTLSSGAYTIDGGVSSQFITGLLFAMALISGTSHLTISGNLESKPYIEMTQNVLSLFGVSTEDNYVKGSYPFKTPGEVTVEGDWSNGAFFLAAQCLGNPVAVSGLNLNSFQGDRVITKMLEKLEQNCEISAADIPDLVPIMAVVAGAKSGATFTNIQRLRLKESDRVAAIVSMLQNLGTTAIATQDTLTVIPGKYHSCTIDSVGDHRIAMASAIAATISSGDVTILNADCVAKSYPSFWEEYRQLGGNYEQCIR